jgi:hypothetical protein
MLKNFSVKLREKVGNENVKHKGGIRKDNHEMQNKG